MVNERLDPGGHFPGSVHVVKEQRDGVSRHLMRMKNGTTRCARTLVWCALSHPQTKELRVYPNGVDGESLQNLRAREFNVF